MKRLLAAVAIGASLIGAAAITAPAFAALTQGVAAPDFTAVGMKGGKEFTFKLSDALKKGPVVVYFFPAAYTAGCTAETKLFADNAEKFAAAGATLVGVTGRARNPDTNEMLDAKASLEVLQKFSAEHCRDKFAIAAVTNDTIQAYSVAMAGREGISDRTSYVIAKDGKVALAYTDAKPTEHITKTLEAVEKLK